MIATRCIPVNSAAPTGYILAERRSGQVFNPSTGAWQPWTKPLAPADWPPLVVRDNSPTFATLAPWPFAAGVSATWVLLWANLGDAIPGDQVVAFPVGWDSKGNPYLIPGTWPIDLEISESGRVDGETYTMLPAPGVTPPGKPVSPTAVPPAAP